VSWLSRRRFWIGVGAAVVVFGVAWAIVNAIMPAWYARLWYPLHNVPVLRGAAHREGLDPALVAGVIQVESKWDPGAVSRVGAVGLMQLLPSTARFIASEPDPPPGNPADLTDPDVSIDYGTWYLRYLINRTGSVAAALVAYNAGEHNLAVWRAQAAAAHRAFVIPADVPFAETRAFVGNVFNDAGIYRRAYPSDLRPSIPGYAVITTTATPVASQPR
jgi:soluble lytic murein transglycosylase